MPRFSDTSMTRLETCHLDIVTLFLEVVQHFDCSVIHGQRTPLVQFELFKQGRELINGVWVKVGVTVTNCDGYKIPSKHNTLPLSDAVDVVPFPIEWTNVNRMRYFVGYVKGIANQLYASGVIEHQIITGMDWDNDTILTDQRLNDLPHFQIKR